jgi:hypothetical protein
MRIQFVGFTFSGDGRSRIDAGLAYSGVAGATLHTPRGLCETMWRRA